MNFLKKFLAIVLGLLLVFAGLWLVVTNDQVVSLNLMLLAIPQVNLGVALLLAFAVGSVVGLLVGFNLFSLFKLNTRLYWLKREVRLLQDALGDRRYR